MSLRMKPYTTDLVEYHRVGTIPTKLAHFMIALESKVHDDGGGDTFILQFKDVDDFNIRILPEWRDFYSKDQADCPTNVDFQEAREWIKRQSATTSGWFDVRVYVPHWADLNLLYPA